MSASSSLSALAAFALLIGGATNAYGQTARAQSAPANPFAAQSDKASAVEGAEAANKLKDIQVGEKGRLLRIAIICERECDLRQLTGDAFRLDGVKRTLDIPLGDRSKLVRALRFEPDFDGSILSIDSSRAISKAASNPCVVDEEAAWCIDLEFLDFAAADTAPGPGLRGGEDVERQAGNQAGGLSKARVAHAPSLKPQGGANAAAGSNKAGILQAGRAPSTSSQATASKSGRPILRQPEATGPKLRIAAAPQLRDATNSDVLAFARFAPGAGSNGIASYKIAAAPSALREGGGAVPGTLRAAQSAALPGSSAPAEDVLEVPAPQSAPRLALVKPIEPASIASAPSLPRLQHQPVTSPPAFDFSVAAEAIFAENFDAARCQMARARLSDDAWALDAMAAVGFCLASEGQLSEADQLFTRLLAYTPDNYQAWVGRALIAVDAGEKSAARRFFQEALRVPPPFSESERIIAAIERL